MYSISLFKKFLFLFAFLVCCVIGAKAQYIRNGSATQNSCNCYTLTREEQNTAGSVWNSQQIDLTQPFDFWYQVNLGCSDGGGADGIAFILQTVSSSVGRNGSGLGFADVSPSIGIVLDTYQNIDPLIPHNDHNDPYYDHISIQANGNVKHGADLTGPVQASANNDNIEDCQWHVLRIVWNPATQLLQAYFDDALRVETKTDLIRDIFHNNPKVYWGFSAATGGLSNVQQFCTALIPKAKFDPDNKVCLGSSINFINESVSFAPIANYYWDLGDGTTSTQKNIPSHTYQQPGIYNVKMALTALDGCKSDTTSFNVLVGTQPNATFTIADACAETPPQLSITNNFGASYQWQVNGNTVSTDAHPQLNNLPAGAYTLKSIVTSDIGCGTDEHTQPLLVKDRPEIEAITSNTACIDVPLSLQAAQSDQQTTISSWNWRLGNGQQTRQQNTVVAYNKPGDYVTRLWATATNGCSSDTITTIIKVVQAQANAGQDTIVLNSTPFQLTGTGNGSALWLPATGLNRNDVLNPTGALTDDQAYELKVTTAEGCIARDTILVEVFKGSAVYVPTAFTPDANGLNDVLRPKYTGIKTVTYFTIYNRWGQQVFTTTNSSRGWDGNFKGKEAASGAYVWMLQAEDIAGKVYHLKGSFVLIR